MKTHSANEAKASFDHIYSEPTPHDYYHHLGRLDYSICDEVQPFCTAAAELLRGRGQAVRMFDIGCSYGINGTILRHGLKFSELNRLFALNVSKQVERAADDTRTALDRAGRQCELSNGGLDMSRPAIEFARDAGILQHGIVADLEADPGALTDADRAWLGETNLLISTGAIGYVTDRTLDALLDAMGEKAGDAIVLLTVLRVFDTGPIERALARHGLTARILPDVLLPQRRFADTAEQEGIIEVLESNQLDTRLERGGRHLARLLVAAKSERMPEVLLRMSEVARARPTLADSPPPRRPAGIEAATSGNHESSDE